MVKPTEIGRLREAPEFAAGGELQVYQAVMTFLVAFRAYLERDFHTFIEYSQRLLRIRLDGDFFIGFGNEPAGFRWGMFKC